jgi:hypothetical protein
MTLELWNTFATFGTFIVIAATAIAALVQLRHSRGSNQIAAYTQLEEAKQTPQFDIAEHFVITELAAKLQDPEFRYQILNRPARTDENLTLMGHVQTVGNYYEGLGLLVRTGVVDRDLVLNLWSDTASLAWDRLAPYAAITRQRLGGDAVWENFEFFVVLSREWLKAHPKGAYPPGVPRIPLKNAWLEADTQYAASRASA